MKGIKRYKLPILKETSHKEVLYGTGIIVNIRILGGV